LFPKFLATLIFFILQVFLISTRAGGLGLNLVSANRVVIFDPNWNPAQDLQAQDRSFRFGQKRHVVVFRLLAAGSFEELVYSRQVYKQQLSNIAVSGKIENRYFEGVQVPFFQWKGWCVGFIFPWGFFSICTEKFRVSPFVLLGFSGLQRISG
jgi:hypothetical protein